MGLTSGDFLMPPEAEHFVQCLQPYKLQDVGSDKWLDQHEKIEQLNKTAHQQAKDGTDEFVMEFFNLEEKVSVLIHNLVTIELWKEKIFPLLESDIASMTCLRNYLPVYHECSIINLLEVIMFHESTALTAGDQLVDLVDYCYRKLTHLVCTKNKDLWPMHDNAKDALQMTDLQLLTQQRIEAEFHICTSAITVMQSLTQHRKALPLTVTTRMIETHDIMLTFVPLMEKAPWVRKSRGGVLQKFEEHEWVSIADDEHTKLPRLQGSLWLAIYNLVMDAEFCARYEMTSTRRASLLRLRRFLHELVFDQIPPLAELLRSLENLSLQGSLAGADTSTPAPFLVEVVAQIREELVKEHDGKWPQLAKTALEEIFSKEVSKDLMQRMGNMVTIPTDIENPICGNCGGDATHRCSRCKSEWYCSRECQVAHWPDHEETCNLFLDVAKKELEGMETVKSTTNAATAGIEVLD